MASNCSYGGTEQYLIVLLTNAAFQPGDTACGKAFMPTPAFLFAGHSDPIVDLSWSTQDHFLLSASNKNVLYVITYFKKTNYFMGNCMISRGDVMLML